MNIRITVLLYCLMSVGPALAGGSSGPGGIPNPVRAPIVMQLDASSLGTSQIFIKSNSNTNEQLGIRYDHATEAGIIQAEIAGSSFQPILLNQLGGLVEFGPGGFAPGLTGHIIIPDVAPTIASGFGTSPTIAANNGAAAFSLNVGTGGSATTGVVTMPTATTGWACDAGDGTTPASFVEAVIPTSATSITIQNYSRSTGLAIAWTASDVLTVKCLGY